MNKKRKCQACKAIKDADLMHKITKEAKTNKLFLNPNSKILGRSAYVCKNPECIKILLKKKLLKGALKVQDTTQIEDILRTV